MLRGVDISKWQGKVDFKKVKASQDFIFIRASYGNGFTDPQFARNKEEVIKNNIPHGYYHYAYPQFNTPKAEAQWFLKVVGELQHNQILVLDFEEQFNGDAVEWCRTFLDYISHQLNGYKPLIYLNLQQTKNYNWKSVIDAGYGLWLAYYDYDPNALMPQTPWSSVLLRQWTNRLKVDGIGGNVDGNLFDGDIELFKKLGYKKPVPPTPPNYELIARKVYSIVHSTESESLRIAKIKEAVTELAE